MGTYLEISSYATHEGTLGHSRLSLLSHCGQILAYRVELVCAVISPSKKEEKKCRWGMNRRTFSKNPVEPGKSHHAELRLEEWSEKAESCWENLWNEIQLKGP